MSSETSSAAAKYAGSSDFKSAISPESIKGNALNESMSDTIGLIAFTLAGDRYQAALKASIADFR